MTHFVILWTLWKVNAAGARVYGAAEQRLPPSVRTGGQCAGVLRGYVRDRQQDGWHVQAPGCFAVAEVGP